MVPWLRQFYLTHNETLIANHNSSSRKRWHGKKLQEGGLIKNQYRSKKYIVCTVPHYFPRWSPPARSSHGITRLCAFFSLFIFWTSTFLPILQFSNDTHVVFHFFGALYDSLAQSTFFMLIDLFKCYIGRLVDTL